MAKQKSYRLLCPIARSLDRLGDRWTLMIIRDLHAGPARFNELSAGLPGLATNLLTTRLVQLRENGLVEKRPTEQGTTVYELTEEGERSAPVLFELGKFGARYPAPSDLRRPGNLRLIVVTLKEALRRAVGEEPVNLEAELVVDDEAFAISIDEGDVAVRYEPFPEAALSLSTDYEALVALIDRRLSGREFSERRLRVHRGSKRAAMSLFGLLGRGFVA